MSSGLLQKKVDRRTLVKTAAVAGVAQMASPFVMTAWSADNVKIGLDNPLTGTYAALGKNELIGCQLAVEQINAKGGILGRKVELLVEDFDLRRRRHRRAEGAQADRPRQGRFPGRQHQLGAGRRDGQRRPTKRSVFHVVPGGHTDSVTGSNCHWNVFRICNTTQMEANAVAGTLIKKAGKKWYYITPDYAFGHTLQAGLEKACGQARRHQGRR